MNLKLFFITTLIGLLVVGCSKDSSSPTGEIPSTNFSVIPSDGASGVSLDAGIQLNFANPVDRSVIERNVHIIGEFAMADSLCPVSDSMSHGMMEMAMMDSMKMNHLMDQHRTRGRFEWNDAGTQCTFRPDSMMMSNMRYMVHMGREMMQMMEDRMGNMGMMGGHGSGMMSNDMMYHFRTMDTTNIGGGHEGHH